MLVGYFFRNDLSCIIHIIQIKILVRIFRHARTRCRHEYVTFYSFESFSAT